MAGCQSRFKVVADLYISRFRGLFRCFSAPHLVERKKRRIRVFTEKGCSWEEGLWRCKHGRSLGVCSRGRRAQEVGVFRRQFKSLGGRRGLVSWISDSRASRGGASCAQVSGRRILTMQPDGAQLIASRTSEVDKVRCQWISVSRGRQEEGRTVCPSVRNISHSCTPNGAEFIANRTSKVGRIKWGVSMKQCLKRKARGGADRVPKHQEDVSQLHTWWCSTLVLPFFWDFSK
jgi:hypothetical protein